MVVCLCANAQTYVGRWSNVYFCLQMRLLSFVSFEQYYACAHKWCVVYMSVFSLFTWLCVCVHMLKHMLDVWSNVYLFATHAFTPVCYTYK